MPAFRRSGEDLKFDSTGTSVRFVVPISQGADGIALTRDGKKAFVYSQFDHRVEQLTSTTDGNTYQLSKTATINVANDTLSPDVVAGRKLFFNATDTRISSPSVTVSCASCHTDGLEDGHTWSFPDGPRQTPTLAGRHISQTAPYHWSGEFGDEAATAQNPTAVSGFSKFMNHTITERMGGTGLPSESDHKNIEAYIESIPAPKNANVRPTLTAAQAHGKQLFETTGRCATCHTSTGTTQLYTNNSIVNVGTLVTSGRNKDFEGQITEYDPKTQTTITKGLNVPSLLGLARSAPYLHDGSAKTLRARLDNDNDGLHGTSKGLSESEKDDLAAYLKTL